MATIGYAGSVTGPIVIGWLSQATSLRFALSLTAVLALVTAAVAEWSGSDDVAPKIRACPCVPSPPPVTSRRCARADRLPGLVEGDDDGLYVAKFRGAGQGRARSSPR